MNKLNDFFFRWESIFIFYRLTKFINQFCVFLAHLSFYIWICFICTRPYQLIKTHTRARTHNHTHNRFEDKKSKQNGSWRRCTSNPAWELILFLMFSSFFADEHQNEISLCNSLNEMYCFVGEKLIFNSRF